MGTKRKEQAAATRQKIIDETQRLIGEKGFIRVTVDDIAAACDIAKGTLYHYFTGKDDIFNYIQRGHFAEIIPAVEELGLTDEVDKLREFVRIWCDNVAGDNLNLSRDWHRLAVEFKLPNSDNRMHLDDDMDNVAGYFKKGIEKGQLSPDMPVEAIAKDIVFAMYGASFFRCASYTGFNIAAWGREFADTVLNLHIAPYRKTI